MAGPGQPEGYDPDLSAKFLDPELEEFLDPLGTGRLKVPQVDPKLAKSDPGIVTSSDVATDESRRTLYHYEYHKWGLPPRDGQ